MITVNDNLYAAYGGEEEYKRARASRETFDYVEDRLVFSDMLAQSIIIDMLLHIHDDIIPTKVIDTIYDEIRAQPISKDTQTKIKDKVNEVIIDNPDCVDEYARQEIERILDFIDVIFDLLNTYNDRIVQNEQKLSDMTSIIGALNNSIKSLRTSLDDISRHSKEVDREIETLKDKDKNLQYQIELLKKRKPSQIIVNIPTPKPTCNIKRTHCDDLYSDDIGRFSKYWCAI